MHILPRGCWMHYPTAWIFHPSKTPPDQNEPSQHEAVKPSPPTPRTESNYFTDARMTLPHLNLHCFAHYYLPWCNCQSWIFPKEPSPLVLHFNYTLVQLLQFQELNGEQQYFGVCGSWQCGRDLASYQLYRILWEAAEGSFCRQACLF